MTTPSPQSFRAAVTHPELLLALGVVAVLAGLFRGSLRRAEASSQSSRCAAHLRQLATAAAAYSADHNDLLPIQSFNRQQGGIAHYLSLPIDFIGDSVFTCPTLRKLYPPAANAYHHRNYSINLVLTFDYKKGRKYRRKVGAPTRTLFFLDGLVNPTASAGGKYQFHFGALNDPGVIDRFTYPHQNRALGVFLDGHVEPVAAEQLEDLSLSNPLWYSES